MICVNATTTDPRATLDDLTAKARIRNVALDLYAAKGEDRVSMRTVAAAAGVTVGTVQHHFKNKDGLRDAVEQLIVDYHAQAIASASGEGTAAEVAAARDDAVRTMLENNPPVVNYLRRAVLDPGEAGNGLLSRLTELSRREVAKLRESGQASTTRAESDHVIGLMVRQLGSMFLQPMVDAMWAQLADPDHADAVKPSLRVSIEVPPPRRN
ncbi:TetR/AcrR family transcriptional regulator [Gordonia desulfuricans]|uniref:TetR/AcrR family transcriptional regulator n=1 Tax=Gordonia desulfuricans TaxID=89051 RepID=A0A7K3LLQ4_9ACTN|nr:TetR/AcrR family transcriptional regulator [Gordonia desulfuricans]